MFYFIRHRSLKLRKAKVIHTLSTSGSYSERTGLTDGRLLIGGVTDGPLVWFFRWRSVRELMHSAIQTDGEISGRNFAEPVIQHRFMSYITRGNTLL